MRVDICKGIDLGMLDKAIAEFEGDNHPYCCKNQYNYLIMSEDTAKAMALESGYIFNVKKYSVYKGDKITIDNSIPYGQVEVR